MNKIDVPISLHQSLLSLLNSISLNESRSVFVVSVSLNQSQLVSMSLGFNHLLIVPIA